MIPALSAKTTALLVDDDTSILRDLCDFLPKSHFFKTFTNPLEGLAAAQSQIHIGPNQDSLWQDFSANRFNDVVSVIVVDYRMKPIDGIEFCKRLGPVPAKRIMLTSYRTQNLAINAFNDNLIDAFLLKTDRNIFDTLSSMIKKCTTNFFNDASAGIDGFRNKRNPLSDENLSKFFFDFCLQNNIASFCCFHDFNNLFLRDGDGKQIFLTIYDEEYVEDLLSSEQAESAPSQVIDAIVKKQAAPCFKNTRDALIPNGAEWKNFMVPLTSISERLFVAIDQ